MKPELIVALDVPCYEDAMDFLDSMNGIENVQWVKVGLELFISDGGVVMQSLKGQNFKVMLDLKLHDIPETVARATKQAIDLGADMLTLHTIGGRKMMEAAQKAAAGKIKLLGVTVLTSMDDTDLREVGSGHSVSSEVRLLAELAGQCGLDGLVCSAQEAGELHTNHPGFLLVTPGIRPAGGDAGDQKRVATPAFARDAGASFIVVGRPIRDASDRVGAVKDILAELRSAN